MTASIVAHVLALSWFQIFVRDLVVGLGGLLVICIYCIAHKPKRTFRGDRGGFH